MPLHPVPVAYATHAYPPPNTRELFQTSHHLDYELRGDPSAPHRIIFNMGVGGTKENWEPQTEYFDERPDEFQYVVYDNRGVGNSETPGGRWTTSAMARDVLSLLAALGWHRDVHVVGLSMGGMVTLELLRQARHGQFASVTLLSTTSGGLHSLALQLANFHKGALRLAKTFLSRTETEQMANAMKILFTDSYLAQKTIHPETDEQTTNAEVHVWAMAKRTAGVKRPNLFPIFKQAMAVVTHRIPADELRAIADKVHGNVVVVTGDSDVLVHKANSQMIVACMQGRAKLVELSNAGHGAAEQVPHVDKVNELIEENVRRASVVGDAAERTRGGGGGGKRRRGMSVE